VRSENNLAIWTRVRGVQSFGRALGGRERAMGGSPGKDRGHRASRGLEGRLLVLVLTRALGKAMGKSQVT